jgi:diguanylate cyclase (GGDEF)-like protein
MVLFACAVMSSSITDPRLYRPARPQLGSRRRLLVVVALGYLGPVVVGVAWLVGRPVDPRLPTMAATLVTVLLVVRVDEVLRLAEHRATHDPLTDVLDHSAFHQVATTVATQGAVVARPERRAHADPQWFLGLLDIDAFKALNDRHGHLVGDEVLVIVARRLRSALRAEDVVGRIGGDEFALLFDDGSPEAVARRVVETFARPLAIDGGQVRISVSLGISRLAVDPANPTAAVVDALRRADRAMYEAKRADLPFAVGR